MPALFMSMSRRGAVARTLLAASLTDAREARSSLMGVRGASGTEARISAMAVRALDALREPMKIWEGLCLAKWRADSFPRPAFPKLERWVSSSRAQNRR